MAKEFTCKKCGRVFTSMMRLQYHLAAEHAPKTVKDIRSSRDIPRSTGQ